MNATLERRALELFQELVELDAATREPILSKLRREHPELVDRVEELLESDRSPSELLQKPMLESLLPPNETTDGEPILDQGAMVGDCLLLGLIGEGAMGVVYEAQQLFPNRKVAIKFLKAGLSTRKAIRRFELEVEALGRLDHPGIARIHAAGTIPAPGGARPYLVMEKVDGDAVTQFASKYDLNDSERIRLFLQVCAAIEHAHQRGVIHRDLKPGNILVTPSHEVKLIDFGVARVLDPSNGSKLTVTEPGFGLGTLPYASPEQIRGSPNAVDMRSDVYALGVILYELLSGKHPHEFGDGGLATVIAAITSSAQIPLGRRHRRFRGDLEGIVGKSIEHELERRYPSPRALADDLGRWLSGEPVIARHLNSGQRLIRWVQRHRLMAAALFVVVSSILTGSIVAFIGMKRAQDSEARLSDRYHGMIRVFAAQVERVAKGSQLPLSADYRHRVLTDSAKDLSDFAGHYGAVPALRAVQARASEILGNLELERGRLELARARQWEALGIRKQLVDGRDVPAAWWADFSISLVKIGDLEKLDGNLESSTNWFQLAFAIDELLVAGHPKELRFIDNLCWSCERIGHNSIVENNIRDAWNWWDRRHGLAIKLLEMDRNRSASWRNLQSSYSLTATLQRSLCLNPEAIVTATKSLECAQALLDNDSENPEFLMAHVAALNNLAEVVGACGDPDRQATLSSDALAGIQRLEKIDPESVRYKGTKAVIQRSRALALIRIYQARGDSSGLAEAYRLSMDAREVHPGTSSESNGLPDQTRAQADVELAHARVLEACGKENEARQCAQRGAALLRKNLSRPDGGGMPLHDVSGLYSIHTLLGDVPSEELIVYVDLWWGARERLAPLVSGHLVEQLVTNGRADLAREIAKDALRRIPDFPSPLRTALEKAVEGR